MNENTMHPLTKEQSDFAAENYSLVFRYLAHKGLDADEFHDVVILPFLRAVQQYNERPELREYAFSTIAWRRMDSALGGYFAKLKRRGAFAFPRGLDVPCSGGLTPEEMTPAPGNVCDSAEARDYWHRARAFITHKQGNVLYLRSRGFSYKEIAEQSGLKIKSVSNCLYRARRKVRENCAA